MIGRKSITLSGALPPFMPQISRLLNDARKVGGKPFQILVSIDLVRPLIHENQPDYGSWLNPELVESHLRHPPTGASISLFGLPLTLAPDGFEEMVTIWYTDRSASVEVNAPRMYRIPEPEHRRSELSMRASRRPRIKIPN